jgi:hypothetical protein
LSEKEKIRGGWRKPHNEERQYLLFSTNVMRVNKPRRMRVAKLVVNIICEKRGLLGEKNLKESLGRRKHRLKCNVQVDPSEIAFDVVEDSCCWR